MNSLNIKRSGILLFFILNISLVYQKGSFQISAGSKAFAQYEDPYYNQWTGADGYTNAEWVAASSPGGSNSVYYYNTNLSPGDYVSQTYYNNHIAGQNNGISSGSVVKYDYYWNTGYINSNGQLVNTHSEYQYSFYVVEKVMNYGYDEVLHPNQLYKDHERWYYYDPSKGGLVYVPYSSNCPPGSDCAKREETVMKETEEDPERFIEDILCSELEKWKNLANQNVSQFYLDRLEKFNEEHGQNGLFDFEPGDYEVQDLRDAKGTTINMDFFPIHVSQLPPNMHPMSIMNYLGMNINSFIDPTAAYFTIVDVGNGGLLNDFARSGTITHIDMGNRTTWLGDYHPIDQPDDGSVMTFYTYASPSYDRIYFRVVTIEAPGDWKHPVSGHREFGLVRNSDGSYTFYTRGIDRATRWIDNLAQENYNSIFAGADKLWKSFQQGIADYINENGGNAVVGKPVVGRPKWQDIKDYLDGKKTLAEIGCKE